MITLPYPLPSAPLAHPAADPSSQKPMLADRRSTHLLELLEAGFQKDTHRFRIQSGDLKTSFARARSFGAGYGSPDDWSEIWCRRWDEVEATASHVEDLTVTMDDTMVTPHPTRLKSASISWADILANLKILSSQVEDLRTLAFMINSTTPKNWDRLMESMKKTVTTAESCLLALNLKLELLKMPSRAEVDKILLDLTPLPPQEQNPAAKRALTAMEEYEEAESDLSREHHQALGFFDAVKTMFMWVESPEERVIKNRPNEVGAI